MRAMGVSDANLEMNSENQEKEIEKKERETRFVPIFYVAYLIPLENYFDYKTRARNNQSLCMQFAHLGFIGWMRPY